MQNAWLESENPKSDGSLCDFREKDKCVRTIANSLMLPGGRLTREPIESLNKREHRVTF